MFNTVITGVDGTDTAYNAARRAAEIALATDATLRVVAAYGKYEVKRLDEPEDFLFTTASEALEIVDDATQALLDEFPGLGVEGSTAESKPGTALVQSAVDLDADLIVIGNKRAQGPARILGSVAREVTAKAPCDVYVVMTHRRRAHGSP